MRVTEAVYNGNSGGNRDWEISSHKLGMFLAHRLVEHVEVAVTHPICTHEVNRPNNELASGYFY